MGQPSSSVVICMSLMSAIEIGFPDLISGPPRGCRSATISMAMLRAMMEGQRGVPPLRAWNASSSGQFLNLVAAWVWEARDVAPRPSWSLRMCAHELMATEQQFFQMMGGFSPNPSCGACRPAMGRPLGSFQIFRHVASSLEPMVIIDAGKSAIRQCVCMILELAPYTSRRCFIHGGRGVARTALLMVDNVSLVHLRCALADREAVRTVPR